MKRTTIMADEALLLDARHLAQQQGMTFTALLQDALREYIAAHRPPRRLPEFVGLGHSSEPNVAERDEEILAAEIDPIEGWSPRRRRELLGGDAQRAAGEG